MITVFEADGQLHAVHTLDQSGLKVRVVGFCPAESNAGKGVHQVPDWAFDGRSAIVLVRNFVPGDPKPICQACRSVVKFLREPPPGA